MSEPKPPLNLSENPAPTEPMWSLEEAILLIQGVQEAIYPFGYCIALGGGVLNNGFSEHDLDLVMVPLSEYFSIPDALKACSAFEIQGSRLQDNDYAWMFVDREQQGETTLVRYRDFVTERVVELRFVTETNIWRQ